MRKLYQVITLLVIITSLLSAQDFRKYSVKSGHVEYELSGNATGTNSVYWDDWGRKEIQIQKSKTTVFGMTTVDNKTTLMLGTDIYTWEEDDNTIQKAENPMAKLWKEKNYTEKDIEKFSKESLESMGFKKTGEEAIDGKNCEVYEGVGGKLWIWKKNQIAIKTNINVLGINVASDATKIELDKNIDASLFELPKDMEIVTVENMDNENPPESADVKSAVQSLFKGNSSNTNNASENNTSTTVSKNDSSKSDGDFTDELINETKDAAIEGAKEGAKDAAKETAKDEAEKATKKSVKSLLKSIF